MADDEEHDFQEEEEDDDEVDFIPGMDEEEEDEEGDAFPLFDGNLFHDEDRKINYQGSSFHLTSDQIVPWNLLDSKVKPKEKTCCLIMNGPCDLETMGDGKQTPRKIEITWTVEDSRSLNGGVDEKSPAVSLKKGDDDNDENDGGKMPTTFYSVFGQQVDASGGDIMEFKGGYHPDDGKKLRLLCQVRTIASNVAAEAVAAKPPPPPPVAAAAAAAAAAACLPDEDDEDDDFDDADDQVDYEELIALHEDAGLPVDALRKRYRGDTEGASESLPKKKAARKEDEDDDDDYGF